MPSANGQLTQRDLYKPENVVAYLRSIESNSIAGMQFRRAADEIEKLRFIAELAADYCQPQVSFEEDSQKLGRLQKALETYGYDLGFRS